MAEELQLARDDNKKLREEFDAAFQEIQNIWVSASSSLPPYH